MQSPSSTVPATPSPKRKRYLVAEERSSLTPERATGQVPSPPQSGADSPRSKVADRLNELDLQQTAAATDTTLPSPRKRLKRNTSLLNSPQSSPSKTRSDGDGDGTIARDSLPEPDVSPSRANARSPDLAPSNEDSGSSSLPIHGRRFFSPPPSSTISPSPESDLSPDPPQTGPSEPSTPGPRPAPDINDSPTDSSPIDRSALTWQESEITGHERDVLSPDDDGEGINGIGFKPTPALAYVRNQKRRQQVSDWKAREAREARQRRMERRRGEVGAAGGTGERSCAGKRAVRFALDVG